MTGGYRAFDLSRRRLLSTLGLAAGGLVAPALLAAPAGADTALDVRILQTASSLETLILSFYADLVGDGPAGADTPATRALAALPAAGARGAITAFARETRRQHAAHKTAFQERTTALGGRAQDAANPKFAGLVAGADLATPAQVLDRAATLEKIATDTYLSDLAMLQDSRARALVAGVLTVDAQHLATLRIFSALLAGGTPEFVALPLPPAAVMTLPGPAAAVAFPDALHQVAGPELIAEPGSGALT